MKRLAPPLSLLCTYGMLGCGYGIFLGSDHASFWMGGMAVLAAAVLALCVFNIVCAVKCCKDVSAENMVRLSRTGVLLKLLEIPYFLLNFAAWVMVSMAFVVIPGFQIFLLGVPLAAAATYVPLLTSSAYTLAAIVTAKRQAVPVKLWHILLELIFVLDVLDAIWLFFHLRKARTVQATAEGPGPL